MLKIIDRKMSLSVIFISSLLFSGCGKDRAGFVDSNGKNIAGVTIVTPIAKDDSVTTEYETSLLIDVLANDTLDRNTALTLKLSSLHGVVTRQDNKFLYTPNNNFEGNDTFEYSIINKGGVESKATVTVEVKAQKNPDTDGDGISDEDEKNKYGTDPKNPDTDGDGLNDGDEVNKYHTNPKNVDSDGDSLEDGEEVNTHHTDPNNKDTDGDCLFDNHEILNYHTDANNTDTDNDGVDDGKEIYGDLTATCEAIGILNTNPAQDNRPIDNDIIDALDPTNDSDGDGWVNIKELNCTNGNPLDITKICPSIKDTPQGEALSSYGYTFIPGAFDVDGDGVKEGGFWTSVYQSTATDKKILNKDVKITIGANFNTFIANNFSLLNSNEDITGFTTGEFPKNEDAKVLTFKKVEILDASNVRKKSMPRYVGATPYMAMVSMKHVTFKDTDSNDLNVSITMLTNKQYAHILKLLDKDKEVNGENNDTYVPCIRNGLLGVDINVPVVNYEVKIEEFDKNHQEFVSDTLHMYSIEGVVFNEETDIKSWWEIKEKELPIKGTNSRDELRDIDNDGTIEGTVSIDGGYYAVMVRGGNLVNLKEGIAGGKKERIGVGIGFRAATDYLY